MREKGIPVVLEGRKGREFRERIMVPAQAVQVSRLFLSMPWRRLMREKGIPVVLEGKGRGGG